MRHVIVPIPEAADGDDLPTRIDAHHTIRTSEGSWITIDRSYHSVPPDDQLTRALDEVTNSTLGALERQDEFEGGLGHDGLALRDMALRLREAFHLDEEGQ